MSALDRVILGTASLTSIPSQRAAFRLLDEAVALGIEHFDTARAYGQGYAERLLGAFIQRHPQVRVTTKVGLGPTTTARLPASLALPLNHWRKRARPDPPASGASPPARGPRPDVPPPEPLAYDYVCASIEESMRLLGGRRLDLLLLHENVPSSLDDRTRDHLLALQRDGAIGRLGVGTDPRVLERFYEPAEGFTILQYAGPAGAQETTLRARFPDHLHVTYGWLSGSAGASPPDALRAALAYDPDGCVLFSTRSVARLRDNVGVLSAAASR